MMSYGVIVNKIQKVFDSCQDGNKEQLDVARKYIDLLLKKYNRNLKNKYIIRKDREEPKYWELVRFSNNCHYNKQFYITNE